MAVRKTGDWALARRLLDKGAARMKAAVATAVRQEAHLLRKHIVEGLTTQAPGGRPIQPLAAITLAARALKGFRGTKALLRRGDLRNAITVVAEGDEAFVGVQRKARSRGGAPLANVAQIQEFGAGPYVVPITPKMQRFLHLVLRRVGAAGRSAGGGGGRRVVVIRVPPRPFLRPAFETFKKGAQRRFLERVARLAGFGL